MKERLRRLAVLGLTVATVTTTVLPVSAADVASGDTVTATEEVVIDNDKAGNDEAEKVETPVLTTAEASGENDKKPEVAPASTETEVEFGVADIPSDEEIKYMSGEGDVVVQRGITLAKGTYDDAVAGTEFEVTKLQINGSDADVKNATAKLAKTDGGDPVVELKVSADAIEGASKAKVTTVSVSAEVAVTAKAGYTVPADMKINYDFDVTVEDAAQPPAAVQDIKLTAKTSKPTFTFDGSDVAVEFEYDVEGVTAEDVKKALSFEASDFSLDGNEIHAIKIQNGNFYVTKVDTKKHTIKVTFTLDGETLKNEKITEGTYDGQITVTPTVASGYQFSNAGDVTATKVRVFSLKSTVKEADVPKEDVFTIPAWEANDISSVALTFTGKKDITYNYSFAGAPEMNKKLTEFLVSSVTNVRIDGETVNLGVKAEAYDNGKSDRGVRITFDKDKLIEAGLKNGSEHILSWDIAFDSSDKDIKVAGLGVADNAQFKFKYSVDDAKAKYMLELEKWGENDMSKPSYTFRGDKDIEYKYTIDLSDVGDIPYDFEEYMNAEVTGVYLNNKVCDTKPTIEISQEGKNGIVKLTFKKEDIIAMGFQRHARPIMKWNIEFTSKKDDVELYGEGVKDETGFMFDYQYQTQEEIDAAKAAENATQAPKTGDTTDVATSSMAMMSALVVMAGVLKKRREELV